MKTHRNGCTRIVITTKRLAFKFPNFLDGWSMFLHGLLANMQEAGWSKVKTKGVCPVLFRIPGGFLGVMRRAEILTLDEFCEFDYEKFRENTDCAIPTEFKRDSFGWLDGEIVAIDYGN